MKKLLLLLIVICVTQAGRAQCTTGNATGCICKDGSTDCDLLPNIEIGHPPFYQSGTYGVIEYSQTGNGADNGRLKITVSTPNTGYGPLELRSTNVFVCGTDTFYGSPPTICPNGIDYPKILIRQRVYHKSGNTMTYYDRDAGTMTYHPSHGHMHVDNWGLYTLRTDNGDPNPLNWPIIGTGTKLAFCVEDYGTCPGWPDHCLDSLGNSLNSTADFPNYNLGGGTYGCSAVVQGITSGYVDVYWTSLDGMWINIPPGICNGNYFIVVQVDPNQNFLEENENDNVYVAPFTLTQQSVPNNQPPVVTASGPTTFCQGENITLTCIPGSSYSWSTGETTQSITVSSAGTYTVTATYSCGTATSDPVNVSILATPAAPVTTDDTIFSPGSATLTATGTGVLNWYDQPSGGTLLGTGPVFNTPVISNSTIYYVDDSNVIPGASSSTGAPDNTIAVGGYYTGDQSLIFDVQRPMVLDSVTVYVQAAGSRTIQLYNSAGTLLLSTSVTCAAGMNRVPVGFAIGIGTAYKITRDMNTGDMYRNNPNVSGSIPYPYVVTGVMSITGTTAGDGYYYFFYDWKIHEQDIVCTGPRSTATAYVDNSTVAFGVDFLNSLRVYPNPAAQQVFVSFSIPGCTAVNVSLVDVIGKENKLLLLQDDAGNFNRTIDVSDLSKGVYFIHIYSSGKNDYHKLVIE